MKSLMYILNEGFKTADEWKLLGFKVGEGKSVTIAVLAALPAYELYGMVSKGLCLESAEPGKREYKLPGTRLSFTRAEQGAARPVTVKAGDEDPVAVRTGYPLKNYLRIRACPIPTVKREVTLYGPSCVMKDVYGGEGEYAREGLEGLAADAAEVMAAYGKGMFAEDAMARLIADSAKAGGAGSIKSHEKKAEAKLRKEEGSEAGPHGEEEEGAETSPHGEEEEGAEAGPHGEEEEDGKDGRPEATPVGKIREMRSRAIDERLKDATDALTRADEGPYLEAAKRELLSVRQAVDRKESEERIWSALACLENACRDAAEHSARKAAWEGTDMFGALTRTQREYIRSSEYIRNAYGPLQGKYPERYGRIAAERASHIGKVADRNGCFAEIVEGNGSIPAGALLHPAGLQERLRAPGGPVNVQVFLLTEAGLVSVTAVMKAGSVLPASTALITSDPGISKAFAAASKNAGSRDRCYIPDTMTVEKTLRPKGFSLNDELKKTIDTMRKTLGENKVGASSSKGEITK